MEQSWKDNFIRDGVTQSATIAEKPGIHGAVRFSYRPMLGQRAELYAERVKKEIDSDPERGYVAVCDIVAEYLTEWDQGLPPNRESLRILKKGLLYAMYYIIRGERASDDLTQPKTGDAILGKS